jgi:hypothetical protein
MREVAAFSRFHWPNVPSQERHGTACFGDGVHDGSCLKSFFHVPRRRRTKRKHIYVISTLQRPVPLEHYLYTGPVPGV